MQINNKMPSLFQLLKSSLIPQLQMNQLFQVEV